MALLLLHLLVLAFMAAAAWLAYAQRLQLRRTDEWIAAPSVDYAALHAQWEREREAHRWDTLVAQVRRWDDLAGADAGPVANAQAARTAAEAGRLVPPAPQSATPRSAPSPAAASSCESCDGVGARPARHRLLAASQRVPA